MAYLYLFIACTFFAFQFVFQKLYERRSASGLRVCFWNDLISCIAASVWMLVTSGIPESMSGAAFLFVVLYSLDALICSACTILAMSEGPLGPITSFCLVGGMVIPFFYGIGFLGESAGVLKWIGIVILTCSVMVPMLFERGEGKKGNLRYYLLCSVVFLTNGLISVFSKMQQLSAAPMTDSGFILVTSVFRGGLAALLLLGCAAMLKKKGEKQALKKTLWEVGNEKMTGKLFAFLAFVSAAFAICNALGNVFSLRCMHDMDASIQFPILSAVVIVLGAVMGRIFFGEKITKGTAVSLLMAGAGVVLFML